MGDRQDRRRFLGMGIGVATAPLLLQLPFAAAADSGRAETGAGDPLLDHLRREALRNYRQVRSDTEMGLGVRGEDCRSLAAHVSLLDAYFADRGHHLRVESTLRERLGHDGRAALAYSLAEAVRSWRESTTLEGAVVLPAVPDVVRVEAGLEFVKRYGVRQTLGLTARWAKAQGIRADGDAERPVRRSAMDQKPGDDFLGYIQMPPVGLDCATADHVLEAFWVVLGILTLTVFAAPEAELAGVLLATFQFIVHLTCEPRV
jgi:hypothetical protein